MMWKKDRDQLDREWELLLRIVMWKTASIRANSSRSHTIYFGCSC